MAEVFCSKCGVPNPADAKFCNKCGAALQVQDVAQPNIQQPSFAQPQTQYCGVPGQVRKKSNGGKIALIVAIIAILAAACTFGIIMLTGGFGAADADYYEIGGDRVPSVSYALDESRKVQSKGTSTKDGIEILTMVYTVSGDEQGDDMRTYFAYLCNKDGFAMREGSDASSFTNKTGSGIQVWRNANESGYMVIVQADYDENGYTITVMRGKGQAAGGSGLSAPGGGGESDDSMSPLEVELSSGDPAIDALAQSLMPPESICTRCEYIGDSFSAGISSLLTYQEVMAWYEEKLPELGFADTMPAEDRAELDADSGEYKYAGTIDGYSFRLTLWGEETLDGDAYCVITMTIHG